MKRQARQIQYTVRDVPDEVDQALRRQAARQKQSLNQVIVNELTRATGTQQKRVDLSDIVGQWAPDPAFDEIIAAQRQIDWEKWK